MSNHPHETATNQPGARKRECLPCDIPRFCRNNYFTGKLLTERDFTAEQTYMVDKLRLHHLALHGWGVVCGLKVKPHEHCPKLRIVVEPGLAIDGCGREIRVMCDVELPLLKPEPPPPETTDPCPAEPVPPPKHAEPYQKAGQPRPCEDDEPGNPECPPEPCPPEPCPPEPCPPEPCPPEPCPPEPCPPEPCPPEPCPPEPCPPEPCPPQPELLTLYVCLRYAECEEEFRPAPFDECACGTDSQKPNRICQSYKLELMTEPPDSFEKIKALKDRCEIGDCESLYDSMLEGCLKPFDLDCIPLAVITNYVRGGEVTPEMIDNKTYRPLLPSTSMLDQVIRCILDKLPTHKLTRIQDYNWDHNLEYGCHEFMEEFVGTEKNPRAFWVEFEGPLFRAGLNPRTFDAIVVRYPEKGGPGRSEVAPVKVWWNDENTRVYLGIDYHYAQTLHRMRFDLFLRLRCNLLVDVNGRPVDGELQARLDEDKDNYSLAPYTGDGIPGGLFESWIRVRS